VLGEQSSQEFCAAGPHGGRDLSPATGRDARAASSMWPYVHPMSPGWTPEIHHQDARCPKKDKPASRLKKAPA